MGGCSVVAEGEVAEFEVVPGGGAVLAGAGEAEGVLAGVQLADAAQGVGGRVAIGAEVAEDDVAEAGGGEAGDEFGGLFVGKVAVAGGDALLEGEGAAGVGFEEWPVVVGFEDEGFDAFQSPDDVFFGVAEVGGDGEAALAVAQGVADGFDGVVGKAEGPDFEVAVGEGLPALEDLPIGGLAELFLDDAGGAGAGEDGEGVLAEEDIESAGVVAVFVGEEDGAELGGVDAEGGEAQGRLFRAQAEIDEKVVVRGADEDGVAVAAAAEDGKFHGEKGSGKRRGWQ